MNATDYRTTNSYWALLFCANLFGLPVASLAGGTVVAWGSNYSGESDVPPGFTNIVGVAAGGFFSVLLGDDGTVYAWGNDRQGETDINGTGNIKALSAGAVFVLSLDSYGSPGLWGGQNWSIGAPAVPEPDFTGTVGLAAGTYHNMVLKSDGGVAAWGNNYYGQCNVPADLTNAVAVAVSRWYCSAALRADGTVSTWGKDVMGSPVTPPAGLSNVVAISCGAGHFLALKGDGTVVAWGDNSYGQCDVPAGLSKVVAVAAGQQHSLVLRNDGTVAAWGNNSDGQCNVPSGLIHVTAISANSHNLALVGNAPPGLTVPLIGSSWTNGVFCSSIPTEYNHVYALEYTDSLPSVNWSTASLKAGNGGLLTVSDPTATGAQRFYRVRRW